MPIHEYYVTKGGVPCQLARKDIHRHGVLVACQPGEAYTSFGAGYRRGGRKAVRAVHRTLSLIRKFHNSIIAEWPILAQLMSPGVYQIERKAIKPTSTPVATETQCTT